MLQIANKLLSKHPIDKAIQLNIRRVLTADLFIKSTKLSQYVTNFPWKQIAPTTRNTSIQRFLMREALEFCVN